jgi:hypothetical protein
VRLGTHPHNVDIIEQITILRIRHFLLTATCVQKVAHPQFLFGVRRLEQSLEFVGFVRLDLFFFVVQLPKDFSSEEDTVGTQEGVAGLEDVVNVTGLKQSVPGGLALPKEGHVRQQVVALRELIEMLDAVTLAPVQEISQPFLYVFTVLGSLRRDFLARNF